MRLGGLQSLRGLAAFSVLVQHATYYSCTAKGIDYKNFLHLDFGQLGVELFFVISGFVMAGCMNQGKVFFLNRILRIYPGYWLSILASFLLLSDPAFGWTFSWGSLFLVPVSLNNSYRIPYWTLVYEMAFYLVTYLMILVGADKKTASKICVVWLLGIVLVAKYLPIYPAEPGLWILFAPLNVYFIFGMLLGLNFDNATGSRSLFIAIGGVVLWAIGDAFFNAPALGAYLPANLLLACAYCAAVVLAIRHIKVPRLEKLGDASYGLYLLHVPIITVVMRTLTTEFPSIRFLVLWSALMVTAFVGATAFGLLEHRIHARIKKWSRRRTLAPAAQEP